MTNASWLGTLVMAATLAMGACAGSGPEAPAEAGARVASVRTVQLETEAAVDRVSLPADLHPARRATLAAEVGGRVETLRVEEGDDVQRGQVLLTVDRRSLEQAVREAEAVFRQRSKQFERARNLFERQSITQAQILDAVTLRDVAQAALDRARLQLEKSAVTAPWTGRVALRTVEAGDYVQPGQPLIELIDVATLEVRAPVAAADVPFVAIGSPVTVRVAALPGAVFEATVVRTAAELDPLSRTLTVEAELTAPDARLKPGLPARVELTRRTWPSALLVPEAAIVERERELTVYVVEDGQARRRSVTVGPLIGDRLLVEDGLEAGDEVIVEGQSRISDGQPVRREGDAA